MLEAEAKILALTWLLSTKLTREQNWHFRWGCRHPVANFKEIWLIDVLRRGQKKTKYEASDKTVWALSLSRLPNERRRRRCEKALSYIKVQELAVSQPRASAARARLERQMTAAKMQGRDSCRDERRQKQQTRRRGVRELPIVDSDPLRYEHNADSKRLQSSTIIIFIHQNTW